MVPSSCYVKMPVIKHYQFNRHNSGQSYLHESLAFMGFKGKARKPPRGRRPGDRGAGQRREGALHSAAYLAALPYS